MDGYGRSDGDAGSDSSETTDASDASGDSRASDSGDAVEDDGGSSPSDADGSAKDTMLADVSADGDGDSQSNLDGGADSDGGGTADSNGDGTVDSDGDTFQTARPALIYVDKTGSLAYLDSNLKKYTVGVSGDIRAIAPSLFYDGDGIREIPYAIADGSGGFSLKVVDLTGSVTTLDKNIMGYTNYGRLGVADVDNDGDNDVLYPNDNKALNYIDHGSSGPTKIVKNGKNGTDAKPQAFMGAIDSDSNGNHELYWIGTGSNVKYVVQPNLQTIKQPTSGFHIGANNNVGVGAPRDLNRNGNYDWAQVDGSNNPGLVPESGGSFQVLNNKGIAAKTPIAFGDVAGGAREEVIFVDMNSDKLRRVSTKNPGTSAKAKVLKVNGNAIRARSEVGVVSGYTAFRERVD